jgi:hypothetical protein
LTQKQKICDEETDRAKKPTKRKKTQKQLGQKQETAQQQQKKNSKNKHPDLRSKLLNPKKIYPLSTKYNRRTHHFRNQIFKKLQIYEKNAYLKVNTTVEQTAEVVLS